MTNRESKELFEQHSEGNSTQDTQVFRAKFENLKRKQHNDAISLSLERNFHCKFTSFSESFYFQIIFFFLFYYQSKI